jgi:hypothetical protein
MRLFRPYIGDDQQSHLAELKMPFAPGSSPNRRRGNRQRARYFTQMAPGAFIDGSVRIGAGSITANYSFDSPRGYGVMVGQTKEEKMRPIAELAREFEASANAIRKWVKQSALDEGLRAMG